VFWGPLAWTIVFGLGFATFVTLLVVPVMYLLNERFKAWIFSKLGFAYKHTVADTKAVPQQTNSLDNI
jgi:Cu/Ag efflux pump CusA